MSAKMTPELKTNIDKLFKSLRAEGVTTARNTAYGAIVDGDRVVYYGRNSVHADYVYLSFGARFENDEADTAVGNLIAAICKRERIPFVWSGKYWDSVKILPGVADEIAPAATDTAPAVIDAAAQSERVEAPRKLTPAQQRIVERMRDGGYRLRWYNSRSNRWWLVDSNNKEVETVSEKIASFLTDPRNKLMVRDTTEKRIGITYYALAPAYAAPSQATDFVTQLAMDAVADERAIESVEASAETAQRFEVRDRVRVANLELWRKPAMNDAENREGEVGAVFADGTISVDFDTPVVARLERATFRPDELELVIAADVDASADAESAPALTQEDIDWWIEYMNTPLTEEEREMIDEYHEALLAEEQARREVSDATPALAAYEATPAEDAPAREQWTPRVGERVRVVSVGRGLSGKIGTVGAIYYDMKNCYWVASDEGASYFSLDELAPVDAPAERAVAADGETPRKVYTVSLCGGHAPAVFAVADSLEAARAVADDDWRNSMHETEPLSWLGFTASDDKDVRYVVNEYRLRTSKENAR